MDLNAAKVRIAADLPNAEPLWVDLAARLQLTVAAHDPGNAAWSGADAVVGVGLAALPAEAAAALAGQTPRSFEQLEALLGRAGRTCWLLADAQAAGYFAQAPAGAGRLVVVTTAPAPAGWSTASVAWPDGQSLPAACRTPATRLWVQVTPTDAPQAAAPAKPTPPAADKVRALELAPGLPTLAPRMARLGTETAFDVLAQVVALRAQGKDIISFGLGEPDFDTPAHIRDTAKAALDDNQTHYGPSQGLPALRQAIADYVNRTRGVSYVTPDHVAVGPGAKPIIFDAVMALVDEGDEVLYPSPGYPIYESVIDWVGGTSVAVPLLESKDWSLDVAELEHKITPRTRMLVLNSPQNPTGGTVPPADLDRIAALAVRHNFWVISDEVYSEITFGAPFASIASRPGMAERTIIIDGFSKTYAMTGWRLGYGVMHPELAKRVARIETNIDSCTCTFTQLAGAAALTGPQDASQEMVRQFAKRATYIVERLNDIDGVTCRPAGGAFYVFPNVTGACKRLGLKTANELCDKLLREAGVAVLPRTCFGRRLPGEDQEYIRLSYATSLETIAQGLDRMKAYIEK